MRLIDADALKETISKYEFTAPNKMYRHGGECVLNFYMPKIIDDAPTIEAKPEKHGEWKDRYNNGDWYCTVCGAIVEKDEQSRHNWYRCYHCGAKMDGGEKN